jgi:hypothetical protein
MGRDVDPEKRITAGGARISIAARHRRSQDGEFWAGQPMNPRVLRLRGRLAEDSIAVMVDVPTGPVR